MKARQAGFTLIEMLVIAPIVVLAIGAFLTVIISMTGEVLASRGSNALAYNMQDAMNRIEADVKLSTNFLASNNITLTAGEAQGYNDDATDFTNVGGTSGTSLILNELVTNGNPLATTSGIVYLADKPNPCASTAVVDNTPMTMNVVYFIKNNTLWRRTIMPSNYATSTVRCSTPWQQPSCAPGYAAAFCKTNDIKLVEGVTAANFGVQYFTSASSTTDNFNASSTGASIATRNAALASIPTTGISITASQSVAGRTISRTATLRATRLETNASVVAGTPTQAALGGAPTNVVATGSSGSQINVVWNTPSGVPTSYTLQYSRKSDFSSPTTVSNLTATSTSITGLSSATGYFFRVSATNTFGTTGYSSTALGQTTGTNVWSAYAKIVGVGDWNNDGKNDLMGYKSGTGDVELHLGNGDGTFGGIITLTNIGTTVRNFLGPGPLPSGTVPVLWWANTAGTGFAQLSDGAWGISGSPIASGNTWNTYTSVLSAPRFYTSTATVVVIAKNTSLNNWSLNSAGAASFLVTNGSGWDAAYPGELVFGTGDMNGDGLGDIGAIDTSSNFQLYTSLGTGYVNSPVSIGSGWVNNRVVGGWDFNSDGKADILRYVTTTNTFMLYTGTGGPGLNSGVTIN